MRNNFGQTIILPAIVGFLRIIVGVLEEKENRIREGMKIMGLTNLSLYSSWIIWQGLINLSVAALVTGILKLSIFVSSDYFLLLAWYWFY